jgi:hypothetical protein
MAPVAAGVKVTLMLHEVWAAREAPQVLAEMANALALVPVMASPESVMAVLSLFVSVTVFAALVLLTPCLPKARAFTEVVASATPVPVRETACGLFVALSAIESVAVMAPVAAGVKVTLILHEVWAAREAPQVFAEMAKALALVPVMVSPESVMAVLSLFVSVTVFAALVLLTPCLPKARVVTEVVAWATPVPVRETVCGLFVALSAIESVAVMAPVAAGVKVTLILHEVWAAREAPQVFAEMAKALALVPVMVSPESVMAVLSLFVSVTVFAALVLLRPCLPKESAVGVNVACASADEPRTSRESKRRVPPKNTLVLHFAGLELELWK